MIIENPEIPEGINISPHHPLRELAVLLGGIVILLAILVSALGFAAEEFADRIPFETEAAFADNFIAQLPGLNSDADPNAGANPETIRIEAALQTLADRIARAQELPPGMKITVHYLPDDTVNAFATLGGHVVMFKGIIDTLHSENGLAMVLAHEIAHVRHRHPIRNMGRSLVINMALATITGATQSDGADTIVDNTTLLTSLNFSRTQETAADETALQTLVALYGHVNGATELFETLLVVSTQEGGLTPPEFLSTHPVHANRIGVIKEVAAQQGWPEQGALVPITGYQ